jgi:uncharacterized membrane protein YjfL (UPF0719 family)
MKHFILSLVIFLGGYFIWQSLTNYAKVTVRIFLRNHGTVVILSIVALLLGLVSAVYFSSHSLI